MIGERKKEKQVEKLKAMNSEDITTIGSRNLEVSVTEIHFSVE